ncbi:hypothetical protein [Pseudarthrobacter sp. TAF60_1]|uniref:hypothetical protein n=1 Tax=Pseudarthrobacter sp. TAF60_1 TaxID=3233071 RepID=UPI003F94FA6F
MTENQWPQTSPSTLDQYGEQAPAMPAGTPSGSASKTDAAKTEASQVANQAAGAAQDVAQTAKAEAANVATEVKTNARDLLHQAKSDLTSQAGTQQQKVAEGMRSISTELRAMADASNEPGVASDLVRQAADRSQSVASWLDGRDPGSLLNEVKSFARQRPGTFLLLAAGAGVLAGRLGRSLQAGAPDSTGTTPRPAAQPSGYPAAYPSPEPAVTAGVGEPFYDESIAGRTGLTDAPYGEPAYSQPANAQPPYGEPAFGEPAYGEQARPGTVADPFAEGEGRHL